MNITFTQIINFALLFKLHAAAKGQCMPGFLKLLLSMKCVCVCVRACVHLHIRACMCMCPLPSYKLHSRNTEPVYQGKFDKFLSMGEAFVMNCIIKEANLIRLKLVSPKECF